MSRVLGVFALVLALGGAAWWLLDEGGGVHGAARSGESPPQALRAAAVPSEPPRLVPEARELVGLEAPSTAGADASAADDAENAEPTCEVVVRLSGARGDVSRASVRLLTTDPDPQLVDQAWGEPELEPRHPNPRRDADHRGVARVPVPVGHELHGVVVRSARGFVWSSAMLPDALELDGAGTCGVELEHTIPGGPGSLFGRVLVVDGSVHHDARVFALVSAQLAAHEAWDPEWVSERPFVDAVDEFGRYQVSRFAGEFDLAPRARDFVPLWSWHGTLEPDAKLRDLDLVLAPAMQLPVSIPALADEPARSVLVVARLAAPERTALLERHGLGAPPNPAPGVELNERVAAAHLDAHGRVSLAVPQHPVWVRAIRGGAPLPLRHDDELVSEVLYDPVHGPLTLIVEE